MYVFSSCQLFTSLLLRIVSMLTLYITDRTGLSWIVSVCGNAFVMYLSFNYSDYVFILFAKYMTCLSSVASSTCTIPNLNVHQYSSTYSLHESVCLTQGAMLHVTSSSELLTSCKSKGPKTHSLLCHEV